MVKSITGSIGNNQTYHHLITYSYTLDTDKLEQTNRINHAGPAYIVRNSHLSESHDLIASATSTGEIHIFNREITSSRDLLVRPTIKISSEGSIKKNLAWHQTDPHLLVSISNQSIILHNIHKNFNVQFRASPSISNDLIKSEYTDIALSRIDPCIFSSCLSNGQIVL